MSAPRMPDLAPPAGDPVRLGQHAGRQLGDDPRGAEPRHGGDGQAALDARGDPGAGAAQPARKLSAAFRRALGGGAGHLSRPLSRDPSRTADGPCRVRRAAGGARRGRGFISASSATRPARCCAAKPSSSAGRVISAASSAPATPMPTSPTRRRSTSRSRRAGSTAGAGGLVRRRHRRRHGMRRQRGCVAGSARW